MLLHISFIFSTPDLEQRVEGAKGSVVREYGVEETNFPVRGAV